MGMPDALQFPDPAHGLRTFPSCEIGCRISGSS
jgi:hypothetical protein